MSGPPLVGDVCVHVNLIVAKKCTWNRVQLSLLALVFALSLWWLLVISFLGLLTAQQAGCSFFFRGCCSSASSVLVAQQVGCSFSFVVAVHHNPWAVLVAVSECLTPFSFKICITGIAVAWSFREFLRVVAECSRHHLMYSHWKHCAANHNTFLDKICCFRRFT